MSAPNVALAPAATETAAAPRPRLVREPGAASRPSLPSSREDVYGRPRKPLGDPAPLACTVAKAALETVLGAASINSLVRWLTPEVRERLAQQRSLARRAGRTDPAPVAISRARVCRVSVGAAEVSIVAECGGRARAVAMRLEDTNGRWLITAIEVG